MMILQHNLSKTFGLKYQIHKEAFKILESYYQPGEFNEGRQKWFGCLKMQI